MANFTTALSALRMSDTVAPSNILDPVSWMIPLILKSEACENPVVAEKVMKTKSMKRIMNSHFNCTVKVQSILSY